MEGVLSDEELLFIVKILSQTTWRPNQLEGCKVSGEIIKKISDKLNNKEEPDK